MAKLGGKFKADEHKDMGFDPIPKDRYKFRITESTYKETAKKNGMNLSLKLVVQEGDYEDRVIYRNLCLEHENEKTQAGAHRELATICRACGLPEGIEDSDELEGIDFYADVAIKSGSGDNPDQNIITKYIPSDEADSTPAPKATKDTKTQKKNSRPIFEDDDEADVVDEDDED